MSSQPKRKYTEEEYLAMDAASESKLEYMGDEIVDLGALNASQEVPGMPEPLYTNVTEEDYLALDRESDVRLEYFNGNVYAMVGASEAHIDIVTTLTALLYGALRGRCKTYNADMRVNMNPEGKYAYPDLTVVCGTPEFRDDTSAATLLNPTVIIEVLSESTELYDLKVKFHSYQQIASLQGYVLIAQDEPRIEVYARHTEDAWLLTQAKSLQDSIKLPAIDLTLQLSEVYAQVTFDA